MNLSHASSQCILALALPLALALAAPLTAAQTRPASVGIFETNADVGANPRKGSASYDTATGEYRVTGGGSNMWGPKDAFHFMWKRATGNFAITADVHFIGKGVEDHRKAVLAVRQSLDPNAA